ncbi:MAG TPA: hypothetical protein VLS89_08960 [Candidatus Nanopelagicales bacterium]|nr:hypothetical protein [Candidatus Nanopelagicales bacterium]
MKGIRRGIEAACALLGIEITAERRAQVDGLDAAALEEVLAHLSRERRWP